MQMYLAASRRHELAHQEPHKLGAFLVVLFRMTDIERRFPALSPRLDSCLTVDRPEENHGVFPVSSFLRPPGRVKILKVMETTTPEEVTQAQLTSGNSPGGPGTTRLQRFEASPQPRAQYRRRYSEISTPPRPEVTPEDRENRPRKSLDENELLGATGESGGRLPDIVLEAMHKRGLLPTVSQGSHDNADKGKRYAEMMERFQIRRISRIPSSSSAIASSRAPTGRAGTYAASGTARDPSEHPSLSTASINGGADGAASVHSTAPPFVPSIPSLSFRIGARASELDPSVATPRESSKALRSGRSARFSFYWLLVSWHRRLIRSGTYIFQNITKPISPTSPFSRARLLVLLTAFAMHVVLFPLETAFFPDGRGLDAGEIIEITVEIVLLVDLVLMFNTAFYNKRNQLVTSRRAIARNYLRSWFLLDLVSSVPVDLILVLENNKTLDTKWLHLGYDVALRSQRIVHIVRLARVMSTVMLDSPERSVFEWLLYSRYSHLLRIAWVVLCIVLIAHYLAGGWRLMFASTPMRGTPIEEYVASFYDVLQLLQGQGVATTTVAQNMYAAATILIGSIVLAIIFGHVAILVSNFNANTTSYQRKMESVFAIMTKLRLPAPLRERIHQYYEHLWREYESLDGEIVSFSKGLSHTLELEVVLFKYMDLIMHVPFWRDGSPDFQKQLMLSLRVRVYLPDDFIIRRGEVGDEFFMINRGVCELVLGPDSFECTIDPLEDNEDSSFSEIEKDDKEEGLPKTVRFELPTARADETTTRIPRPRRGSRANIYALGRSASARVTAEVSSKYIQKLRRGQSFGEIALLMNYERTANVRALTYVEMCVLHREDFQNILVKHPKDRKQVILRILTKTMENNEATKAFCPLKAMVQSVFGEGDSEKAESISATHAALLISNAVNLPLDDDSIKLGVGVKLREQLVELRDKQKEDVAPMRRPSATHTAAPTMVHRTDERQPPAPSATAAEIQRLADQVEQLEHVQTHMASIMLALTHEVNLLRSTNEQLQKLVSAYATRLADITKHVTTPSATSKPPASISTSVRLSRRLSRQNSMEDLQAATIPENQPRVTPLIRYRSASMSNLNTGRSTGRNSQEPEDASLETLAKSPQLEAARSSRRASHSLVMRSASVSRLTLEATVNGKSSSMANLHRSSDETKRPSLNSRFLSPLRSLLGQDPQLVQSPTKYADQLFQAQK